MGAILAYGKHKNEDQRYEFSTTFEASFNVMKNLNVRANYSYMHYNYQTMNRTVNVPYSKYPGEISYLTTGSGVNQLKNMLILQGVEWSISMKLWERCLLWTARYVLPIAEM